MLHRPRTGSLKWDADAEAWVGEGSPLTAYGRIKRHEVEFAADSFWGGLILGICVCGNLFTLVMALAFSTT